MTEKKKREAVYNPEADKRYRAKLTDEQKAENNRRGAFVRAKAFIEKERYTREELQELNDLITEKWGAEND